MPVAAAVGYKRERQLRAKLQGVRAAVRLGGEVAPVRRGQVDGGGHPLDHLEAVGGELGGLVRVVGEQRQPLHAQGGQHLRGGRVVAGIGGVAEREVGVVGVQPVVLEQVGVELGVQPDAA